MGTKANKVGINEIAAALGISKSTVSRALNNHPKISEATKQKVLKQAQELGYTPNIPDLISNKDSRSIALIIPHSKNTFFAEITESVRNSCNQIKYSLFICESHFDIETERQCIEQIKTLDFQALIYVAHKETQELESLDYLSKTGFPLSIIHENHLKSHVPTIILDVHQSIYDGIKHLKSNEAKTIGLIIDEKENAVCDQVSDLFESMLKQEDLNYNPDLVYSQSYNEETDIAQILNTLFANKITPDALIFGSYNNAYKALQFLNINRITKKEVLIMSINSSPMMHYAKPNISYLQLQGTKVGNEAARLIFKQLNKAPKSSTKVFFSRLIIKSSSLKV